MTASPLSVLVVDDERHIRSTLRACIEGEGHAVTTVDSAGHALAAAEEDSFDIALLDLRLGTKSGLDLLPALLGRMPWLKVIVITAYATIESVVEAMRLGASDYLPKPFEPAQVRLALEKVVELRTLERHVDSMRSVLASAQPDPQLDSRNSEMNRAIQLMQRVAATDATVLLQGESGTGKGVFARQIHAWSDRYSAPFVVVHAPSLSAELLESELFGHVKGAFTGAVRANPGRVFQAEGGTLFLDEIGELPLPLQTKLLRFLQEREYERVGDTQTRHSDVRIVAATNRELVVAVEESRFRKDLYYRLKVVDVTIPPLRERPQDIAALTNDFLVYYARRYNRRPLRIGMEAAAALRRYSWPGNVRELQNTIERAVILTNGEEITPESLPFGGNANGASGQGLGALVSLSAIEEVHIRRVIESTETLDEAADVLGIDPATLWRRRQKYGI
jgi:NtrC-family two-component system response regulator AlgB